MKTLIIILLILGTCSISWTGTDGKRRNLSLAGLCNLIVIILLLLGKWS